MIDVVTDVVVNCLIGCFECCAVQDATETVTRVEGKKCETSNGKRPRQLTTTYGREARAKMLGAKERPCNGAWSGMDGRNGQLVNVHCALLQVLWPCPSVSWSSADIDFGCFHPCEWMDWTHGLDAVI